MFEHTRALLMRPQHAAREAGVTTHTLANWADQGRLSVVRTVGGQRRYLAGEIAHLAHQRAQVAAAERAAGIVHIDGQLSIQDALEAGAA